MFYAGLLRQSCESYSTPIKAHYSEPFYRKSNISYAKVKQ